MKTLAISIIGVLFMLLITGTSMAHTVDDPFVTDLIAGGGNEKSPMDAGDVEVWNDGVRLYVKYNTTNTGWYLTETHLHVSEDCDIPQTKKGNPIPGKFAYPWSGAGRMTVLYWFNLGPNDWDVGDELCIAAHSVVYSPCYGEETAWGDGCDFDGASWATFFNYTVQ